MFPEVDPVPAKWYGSNWIRIRNTGKNHINIVLLGEVIKTGDFRAVHGEGMPQYRNPFEKGRLIISFNVVFPESLDPAVATNLSAILPAA